MKVYIAEDFGEKPQQDVFFVIQASPRRESHDGYQHSTLLWYGIVVFYLVVNLVDTV